MAKNDEKQAPPAPANGGDGAPPNAVSMDELLDEAFLAIGELTVLNRIRAKRSATPPAPPQDQTVDLRPTSGDGDV